MVSSVESPVFPDENPPKQLPSVKHHCFPDGMPQCGAVLNRHTLANNMPAAHAATFSDTLAKREPHFRCAHEV